MRIKRTSNGEVLSVHAIIDYGHFVQYPEAVSADFCIESQKGEQMTYFTIEFLDSEGNLLCFKNSSAQCNCNCELAGVAIAPGVPKKVLERMLTKIGNEIGNCCWEFSIFNNYSCKFSANYTLNVEDLGPGTSISAVGDWIDVGTGSTHKFVNPGGIKYNSSSTVFKICTIGQAADMPKLNLNVKFRSHFPLEDEQCTEFKDVLECLASENCCDKLNFDFKSIGSTRAGSPCAFNLMVSKKNALADCDVYGIRIKTLQGQTLHYTGLSLTPIDLAKPTFIYYDDLGPCDLNHLPGTYGRGATYIIEILDANGVVLCSVEETFQCCYEGGSMTPKIGFQEPESDPIQLSIGGYLADIAQEGGILRYIVHNNGEVVASRIQLSGSNGDIILENQFKLIKGRNVGEFDISKLARGTYFLMVQTDNWQTARKIIITR